MKKRASIDIGSNSILLLIAEFDDGKINILENESNVTGLGRDLDKNGIFIDEAMDESFSVFKVYAELCKKHGLLLEDVVVTATEASRVATNAQSYFQKIKKEIGFEVKIITGEAEAYFSTTGILFDDKIIDEFITIMDIGGASTELIRVNVPKKEIIHSFSMPVGAVRMNNWNLEGTLKENLGNVLQNFQKDIERVKAQKLFCVAGTMTSLGNIYLNNKNFNESEVNGLEFQCIEVDKMYSHYKDTTSDEFLKQFPFLGKRSKTIYSGIILAKNILDKLESSDVYISTYGLRYGTLLAGEIKNDFIHGA
ncbi:MAG: exopolyphosphatase/guanosine-5'-triphosphate,3'-diphosphate pyrophosphatase [Bacteriovoracaceae bacterium]|jgi:exopolyphosphatase/guanosine-5'-triphosphate,3'-diphosphate pyrophosphatase